MYEGAARDRDAVAVVHDDARFALLVNRNVHVETVDGQSTMKFLRGTKIELLPGVHVLGVRFLQTGFGWVRSTQDLCWITLHAAAGAEYRIASEVVHDRVRIWLFDVKTGEQTQCYLKQPGEQT
jgi:hypothetical protein